MQLNRDTMSGKMPREQLGSRSNIIPSLAELASRAVEERLNNMCDEIPDEAEDRIADRRQRLHAELAVLANEKQEYINKRMVELSLERPPRAYECGNRQIQPVLYQVQKNLH